jgi:hypothetical protein
MIKQILTVLRTNQSFTGNLLFIRVSAAQHLLITHFSIQSNFPPQTHFFSHRFIHALHLRLWADIYSPSTDVGQVLFRTHRPKRSHTSPQSQRIPDNLRLRSLLTITPVVVQSSCIRRQWFGFIPPELEAESGRGRKYDSAISSSVNAGQMCGSKRLGRGWSSNDVCLLRRERVQMTP